jgi:hypothetical protein
MPLELGVPQNGCHRALFGKRQRLQWPESAVSYHGREYLDTPCRHLQIENAVVQTIPVFGHESMYARNILGRQKCLDWDLWVNDDRICIEPCKSSQPYCLIST